jgi:hypothetical protein
MFGRKEGIAELENARRSETYTTSVCLSPEKYVSFVSLMQPD